MAERSNPAYSTWYARRTIGPDGEFEICAVYSNEYPDGSVQEVPAGLPPTEARPVIFRAVYSPDGHPLVVKVTEYASKRQLALWYVSHPEPDADPVAHTLIAFSTPDFGDGVFVQPAVLDTLGIDLAAQPGATRWWTDSGQFHQIYVAPKWRRKGVASKMILVAAAFGRGHGTPRLWGIGDYTDLGVAWMGGAVWSAVVPPRTKRLPAMTPEPDAVGVPPRNLVPDGSAEVEPSP